MIDNSISGVRISGITTSIPSVKESVDFHQKLTCRIRRSIINQTSSDLAYDAALRLLDSKQIDISDIGFLIFVSTTPDYRSPNTAAILQGRLGLSIDCISYDINRGNNSFVSGLVIGGSILKTINKKFGLVLLGDSLSKIELQGSIFSSIASDAGSALLLEKADHHSKPIKLVNKTIGSHFKNFSIPKGGFRLFDSSNPFDSTLKGNFQLKFDHEIVANVINKYLFSLLDQFDKKNDNSFIFLQHSLFQLLNIQIKLNALNIDQLSLEGYGYTSGSNLPLQLSILSEKSDTNQELQLRTASIGEGLEISLLEFTIDPNDILPTKESNDCFSEFQISHEM